LDGAIESPIRLKVFFSYNKSTNSTLSQANWTQKRKENSLGWEKQGCSLEEKLFEDA
jgi:hypothetical protein